MLLIFDCDGVVCDSMPLHNEVEAAFYATLGLHFTPAELAARFAGVSLADELKILEAESGCKIPSDFGARLDAHKKQVFSARLKPMPGLPEMLDSLKETPRCIASGTAEDLLVHSLKVVGAYDAFAPHIYNVEMVAHGKPAPDLFLYAAQSMGHAPQDCIVIEDGAAGVQAGVSAGMRVFGFTGGTHCAPGHAAKLQQAGAERCFNDLRALPDLMAQAVRLA